MASAIDALVALLEAHEENDKPAFVITLACGVLYVLPRYDATTQPVVVAWDKANEQFRLTMNRTVKCETAGEAFEAIRRVFFGARTLKFS